jgi:hypothetical protein
LIQYVKGIFDILDLGPYTGDGDEQEEQCGAG